MVGSLVIELLVASVVGSLEAELEDGLLGLESVFELLLPSRIREV